MRAELREGVLVVEFDAPHRCLSSAVLGGGLGEMRSWLNTQVPSDYARTDPEAHLAELVRELGLPRPAVGMMTASLIEDYVDVAPPVSNALGWGEAEGPRSPRTHPKRRVPGARRTDHLDVGHQLVILALIKNLRVSTLAALHDLNIAALFCDRLYVLHGGEILASGSPEEVLRPKLIREVYGVTSEVSVHPATGKPHIVFVPAHH